MTEKPPPSALAVAFGSAVIAGLAGYFLGQAQAIGVFSSGTSSVGAAESPDADGGDDVESEDEEDEDEVGEDLKGFEDSGEECKLVLVVRTDLGMTKGKIAAQCGHATLSCYKTLLKQNSPILKRWEAYGQAKVALQVKSEEEMEELQATALSLGICARVVHDAGRTQIKSGSATVLGVGPAPKGMVDVVTGHLKLL